MFHCLGVVGVSSCGSRVVVCLVCGVVSVAAFVISECLLVVSCRVGCGFRGLESFYCVTLVATSVVVNFGRCIRIFGLVFIVLIYF